MGEVGEVSCLKIEAEELSPRISMHRSNLRRTKKQKQKENQIYVHSCEKTDMRSQRWSESASVCLLWIQICLLASHTRKSPQRHFVFRVCVGGKDRVQEINTERESEGGLSGSSERIVKVTCLCFCTTGSSLYLRVFDKRGMNKCGSSYPKQPTLIFSFYWVLPLHKGGAKLCGAASLLCVV